MILGTFTGRRLLLPFVAALLAATVAAPLEAQSLFAGRGLGYVVEPLDARARGLGSVSEGLPEASLSLTNPAGVAGLPAPAIHVTIQPDQFATTFGAQEVSGSTVRFPVLHVAMPYGRWTASIGYAPYLDRNWAAQRDTSLVVGGQPVAVRDRFASHGGVARLRAGAAYGILPRLAVGAAVDVYTGIAQDTTYRVFTDAPLFPTVSASSVRFRGLGYSAGARWIPSDALALGAAITAGGQLEVRPTRDGGSQQTFDLPLQFSGGATGRITPTTLVALSGKWSGWSSVDGALAEDGGARDIWSVSGGIEWDALRMADRVVPFRLGAHHALLPFRWMSTGTAPAGDGWATERGISVGTGVRVGGAALDASLERGTRGGEQAGITEDFWRMAFSLTVLGR